MMVAMTGLLVLLAAATVQPAADTPDAANPANQADLGAVIRLSPEESDRAIEEGAARRAQIEHDQPDRRIHGEMGIMVGTGGTRGIYGQAAIPLGDNAAAAVAFSHYRSREVPLYPYGDGLSPYGVYSPYGAYPSYPAGRRPLRGPVFPD